MPDMLTQDDLHDPVVKHMRTDFVQLSQEQTVEQALASIRANQPEGRIIYFYVVAGDGRLLGVVPTRRLLLSPRDRPLADIMVKQVITIPHTASVLDACEFFILHKLLAFPVVDDARRMIGLVDVDVYTNELSNLDRHDESEQLFQLIGVHLSDAQQASPMLSFRKRFPWLLTNIAGGIVAALVAGFYEAELQHTVALALFIPVVLALAESVCIQSVSLALQSGHTPRWRDLAGRLVRELCTGLFLGGACGLLVGVAAFVWIGQVGVAVCILGGIGIGVTGGATLGIAVPSVLRLLQRDPQVAAGPLALALTDMLTLLLYLTLARWLLTA
jgi:magnesium transporter